MRVSFKNYLAELSNMDALAQAAKFLNVDHRKMKVVDPEIEAEVTESGREMKKQFIKVASGNIVVIQYMHDKVMYARIEYPDGEKKMFQAS